MSRSTLQHSNVGAERPLIAHVIYRFGIGGLENGLVNLLNNLPAERFRHAVVCLAGFTDFKDRVRRPDVQFFDIEKKPGKDIAHYGRLFRLFRRIRPDIVHTRNFAAIDCQFIAAAAGVRHRVHGEHGWDVGDLQGSNSRSVRLRRLSRAVVHEYVAVSRHMAEWLQNEIRVPPGKISQIYNGVDTDSFRPPADADARLDVGNASAGQRLQIGIVGRLDPIKDHITLLKALERLVGAASARTNDCHVCIVGGGEMESTLRDYVQQRNLESCVTFAGASNDVPGMLRNFDVFVLPSLNEGISNTILEAMATGLPVIATRAGGNSELVRDGETGTLFEPGDVAALANHLAMYRDDPDMRRQRGAHARATVISKFSLDAMVSSYTDMYDNQLEQSARFSEVNG